MKTFNHINDTAYACRRTQFQIACHQNDALIHIQFRLGMSALRRQTLSHLWLKASDFREELVGLRSYLNGNLAI